MNGKIVNVGVFWAIPDKIFGQSLLEFHERYYTGEADINGFVNYSYSHYEIWEEDVDGLGNDCYRYPRGRVLYDANSNKHRIFCDKHIDLQIIDEIIMIFDIDDYEICRASKRASRLTYMDVYMSLIDSAAGGRIPRPDVFKDVVAFTPRGLDGRRKDMFFEIQSKRGLKGISAHTDNFTMFLRPTMLPYLKKLFALAQYPKATLIYSIWKGYKKDREVAEFLDGVRSLGIKVVDLHTSGHASAEDIQLLKQAVNAKQTVCVHTQFHG